MFCEQFEELLVQQVDGPLPVEAAAHIETCSRCSLLRDDLVAIEVAAREWGSEEPVPPARVWAAIQAQLAAEGLVAPSRLPVESQGWLAGLFHWAPRLELAGASELRPERQAGRP